MNIVGADADADPRLFCLLLLWGGIGKIKIVLFINKFNNMKDFFILLVIIVGVALYVYFFYKAAKEQKDHKQEIKEKILSLKKISGFREYDVSEKIKEKVKNKLQKISPKFSKYEENILKTIKPYINISASESENLKPWNSKIGGNPYLPKGFTYPKNSYGEDLYLLAQINFAEIPKMEGFPESGILEFFVSACNMNTCTFGIDDDYLSQKDIRILYFEEVQKNEDELINDFSFLKELNSENFPEYSEPIGVTAQYELTFVKRYAPISYWDFQFDLVVKNQERGVFEFFKKEFGDGEGGEYKVLDRYTEVFQHEKTKIGGYPAFEQNDPRAIYYEGVNENKYSTYDLLFMMGNSAIHNIGIFNFFIKKEDLANKDFSEVLFYFDNG